jgi:hypothetical protein
MTTVPKIAHQGCHSRNGLSGGSRDWLDGLRRCTGPERLILGPERADRLGLTDELVGLTVH